MTTEKKFVLQAAMPSKNGDRSIHCLFSKSTFEDGIEQEGAEQHVLVVPRFVGKDNDIPSDLPYLRRQLDQSADELGFERCTDADWQTILDASQLIWSAP